MCVPGYHQIDALLMRRVGGVGIVREQNAARIGGRLRQQGIERGTVLPEITGSEKPQHFAAALDAPHPTLDAEAGFRHPMAGAFRVGPMVMIPEHGQHTFGGGQLGHGRPHPVNLGVCVAVVHVIAGAHNDIAPGVHRPLKHTTNEGHGHEQAVVQVGKLDHAKAREGRRQIGHRNSVGVHLHQVALDDYRVAAHQPGRTQGAAPFQEMPPVYWAVFMHDVLCSTTSCRAFVSNAC